MKFNYSNSQKSNVQIKYKCVTFKTCGILPQPDYFFFLNQLYIIDFCLCVCDFKYLAILIHSHSYLQTVCSCFLLLTLVIQCIILLIESKQINAYKILICVEIIAEL